MKTSLATLLLIVSFGGSAAADTFTVNNPVDPGNGICDVVGCTLREAIDAANVSPGADIINFNIAGSGVTSIVPTTPLPDITDTVTIDGYSQPGASVNTLAVGNDAVLLIELNGILAAGTGMVLISDSSIIRGLVINRFDSGIRIDGGKENNVIEGNFIGTDAAGIADLGNSSHGVLISSGSNNLIGGPLPAARNLLSGNGSSGVAVFGCCGDQNNMVQGNYIGTNRDGTAALPNDEDGVNSSGDVLASQIGGAATGAGNLISGNGRNGIHLSSGFGGFSFGNNIVQGNLIGTDATGGAALGNADYGVLVVNGPDNLIGGTIAATRNVISGNTLGGVRITSADATGNLVQGNHIGTDAAGGVDLGNTQGGVSLIDAPDNTIGGSVAGAGNVISGNGFGVQVSGLTATGNQIQGNRIGTDAAGTGPLGNNNQGVLLDTASSATTVGGSIGAGNIIAFNSLGVSVVGFPASTGNSIFGNSIFGNDQLGIDLGGDSVTANDFPDSDTGANNLQNYPVLDQIAVDGENRAVEGSLTSNLITDYVLNFYSNAEVDASGFGEGETWLGALDVQTNAQSTVDFSFPLDASAFGRFITATATDPNGNTSEFSLASAIVPSISRFLNISTRLRVQTGDNVLIGGFIITGNDPTVVIIRAIGPSLGEAGVQGFLVNPILELHYPDATVVTNDDWRDTQEAEIIATTIPPDDDLEAAIVATLDPGAYTAIVRGVNGGTGIGLVEAYDLSSAAGSALANISTRGFVESGDNVMIGGIIVGPEDAADGSVLIRALGPSLTDLGVPNALADPLLELRDVNGALVTSNNDWKSTQQAAIEATGIPPNDDKESALLATLTSGNYTAIVLGGGGTGVGLVEAYHLD
jgi:CSLREA domain-containing protein